MMGLMGCKCCPIGDTQASMIIPATAYEAKTVQAYTHLGLPGEDSSKLQILLHMSLRKCMHQHDELRFFTVSPVIHATQSL